MGETKARVSVEVGIAQRKKGVFELIPKTRETGPLGVHNGQTLFSGFSKTDDTGDVQGSAAHIAFVTAPVHLRGEGDAGTLATDIKGADALWTIYFVRAKGEQVYAVSPDVDRDLTHGLGGIAEKQYAVFAGDGADLPDGLEDAGFVVGVHQGYEDGIGSDSRSDLDGLYESLGVDGEIGDLTAHLLYMFTGIQHRLVLGLAGNEVVALWLRIFQKSL